MSEQNYFKIVSIDPGTNKVGICLMDVEFDTFKILKSTAFTVTATKLVSEDSWMSVMHSYRVARLFAIKDTLLRYFKDHKPNAIVCESPFFNSRMPGAFQPLVEILKTIRDTVIEYDDWLQLNLIDPSTIKKAVNASSFADKQSVKKAVTSLVDINYEGNIDELDEHAIDALAVGYCFIKNMNK